MKSEAKVKEIVSKEKSLWENIQKKKRLLKGLKKNHKANPAGSEIENDNDKEHQFIQNKSLQPLDNSKAQFKVIKHIKKLFPKSEQKHNKSFKSLKKAITTTEQTNKITHLNQVLLKLNKNIEKINQNDNQLLGKLSIESPLVDTTVIKNQINQKDRDILELTGMIKKMSKSNLSLMRKLKIKPEINKINADLDKVINTMENSSSEVHPEVSKKDAALAKAGKLLDHLMMKYNLRPNQKGIYEAILNSVSDKLETLSNAEFVGFVTKLIEDKILQNSKLM